MIATRSEIQAKRLAAAQTGATTFDPGQPCKYGHDSQRYTRSGQCVTCSKATSRKAYQDMVALMPAATYNPKPSIQPKEQPKPAPKPTIKSKPRVVPKKPDGVAADIWEAFNILRKGKKAPVTQAAIDGLAREANKAGITLEAALNMCVTQGWQGFQARYLHNGNGGSQPNKPSLLWNGIDKQDFGGRRKV